MLIEETNKKGKTYLIEVTEGMKLLINKEQRELIKRKIKLYQVFRYNHTGSHFFFGTPPYNETEIHLWVLEESLSGCPTNYKGKVTCEPRFYKRADKCIYIDCGYGGESGLYADKIMYLTKGNNAALLQSIVNKAKDEHSQLTREEWKRRFR
jgi:hypothetical protein